MARGLPLGPGDEVLFSSLNHVSGPVAWDELAASRGVTVRRFDLPPAEAARMGPEEIVACHADAVGLSARVLVLPRLDNMVGLRHPVGAIAEAVRARGAPGLRGRGAVDGDDPPLSPSMSRPTVWISTR